MKKEKAKIFIGRGPFGADFFELYIKDGEIWNTKFAGHYQDNCKEIGKEYAKKMLKEGVFEYTIINGKIPIHFPLPMPQDGINTLIAAIEKESKDNIKKMEI